MLMLTNFVIFLQLLKKNVIGNSVSENLDALSLNTCWDFFLPEAEKVSS